MLLKSQRNQFFQELLSKGLEPTDFTETMGDNSYCLKFNSDENLRFEVRQSKPEEKSRNYVISRMPGWSYALDNIAVAKEDSWENGSYGVWPEFRRWSEAMKQEVEAPDLWLETIKAVQLFEPAAELTADKFTIAELGALHGQLRMLRQLFENSELLRGHRSELAELTQTATVKAESFTKKDWQNWVKGAFISAITSLELTEEETQELLALVRLAFGGLFLKQ